MYIIQILRPAVIPWPLIIWPENQRGHLLSTKIGVIRANNYQTWSENRSTWGFVSSLQVSTESSLISNKGVKRYSKPCLFYWTTHRWQKYAPTFQRRHSSIGIVFIQSNRHIAILIYSSYTILLCNMFFTPLNDRQINP